MPRLESLSGLPPWERIDVTDQDWDVADRDLLCTMFSQLTLIRTFEEYVLELASQGLINGPAHSSIGQEGGAVGSVLALREGDTINGSHRGHHQFLAKALSYVEPMGINPVSEFSDAVKDVCLRTLAEICGLKRGFGHGRGGSMHLKWRDAGAMGTNAIVGGGVPLAAGSAWAHRQAGRGAVSVSYFGDGAMNIGSTLETLNLAAAWALPLCLFVENNQYAVSTRVDEATGDARLSARGPGFGVRSIQVDGMNVLATFIAMKTAVEHIRAGRGPILLEAEVYRYYHQNGPFRGSAFRYRTREEEEAWEQRDPIRQLTEQLLRLSILSDEEIVAAKRRSRELMDEIGSLIFESVEGKEGGNKRIRSEEWPDPAFVDVGLRSDLSELSNAPFADWDDFAGSVTEKIKFIDVVAGVMQRRMAQDGRIVVLGEDVHRLSGGTNGATRGLRELFPDRVLGTPISENAFCGLGGGIALDGRYIPVVELMYADFLWVAADQLFNQIGKARHMFGGDDAVPLVLRTKVAIGTGYGSQHSMDPAGIFTMSPGWRVVAPSTPFDYIGLMNTALRCSDPVLVIEHVDLYGSMGEVVPDQWDYCIPVGKARVRRTGSELTIISYLGMIEKVIRAVDLIGIDAEVIDLRWLDRSSIDWCTIEVSLKKTNRLLIAEEGPRGTSYGGWLSDEIQRRYFDWLDAPIERLTGAEASPSISRILESAAIPGVEDIAEFLRLTTKGNYA